MTTTSVVIRALNEEKYIGRLLAGLSEQSVKPDEIILVDSGSTDATVSIAEHYGCRIVHIKKEEFSFGRALNIGCEAATGEVLIFMSAHVYPVYDTYIEHIAKPFDDPKVAVAYGRHIGDERTKYSEARLMLKWFPEHSVPNQGHGFSNNGNCAVRRTRWQETPYDEELTGLEDLDFANKAVKAGFKVSYVAEAAVVHVHEESWSRTRNRYRREAIAYERIMGKQRMSALEAIGLGIGNIVSDYFHAVFEGKLLGNLASIPGFRTAQFLGAWEGYRSKSVSAELKQRFYYPHELSRPKVTPPSPGRKINYTD
jgi:glycosyltransferase involved in cell wall biosynthesis